MSLQPGLSPHFWRSLKLAITLLTVMYMLLIGGAFNATVQFRVQALNAGLACLAATGWLAVRWLAGARIRLGTLEWLLMAFAGSYWVASLTSDHPRLSLEQAAALTTWVLGFIIVSDLLRNGWPSDFVLNALIIAAGLVAGQLLWEVAAWHVAWLRLGSWPLTSYRAAGFLGHPNLSAGTINLLLPFVGATLLRNSGRAARLGLGMLIACLLAAEFFTSSRAGWIAGFATLAIFAALGWLATGRANPLSHPWLAPWRSAPLVGRLGLVTLGAIAALAVALILQRQMQHASHPDFFSSRQSFWLPAWNEFIKQPLTGGGPGLYVWHYTTAASIPPDWLSPHAHSLPLQILSEAGLLGFGLAVAMVLAAALRLKTLWADGDRLWAAACSSAFGGLLVHHLFDYLFGTPSFTFLFVAAGALAFGRGRIAGALNLHPGLVAAPILAVALFTFWWLRAANANALGVQLAQAGQWHAASEEFRKATRLDPDLGLYWQSAAQAAARAGDTAMAAAYWEQAVRRDPHYAVPPANLAIVRAEPALAEAAVRAAPDSHLMALNAAAAHEAYGSPALARHYYLQALSLSPGSAEALFWKQTELRQHALSAWRADQAANASGTAHEAQVNDPRAVIERLSDKAHRGAADTGVFVALARAHWELGDEHKAEFYLHAARLLPVLSPNQLLEINILEGDWADAHGDRPAAIGAYSSAFSMIHDYNAAGPGTYGYSQRSWYLYHRLALPSDLAPGFARADISATLDNRFALLAAWLFELDRSETACLVLHRVYAEAPSSGSGQMWKARCQSLGI